MKKLIFTTIIHPFGIALLTGFLVVILPYTVNSKSKRSEARTPDQEKRSCIQVVDGYAYLSEDMTLAETRAAAFANAKRQAVEMAHTYIQSKTVIEDFVLKKDRINETAEGAVTILEQKDFGIEDNTRYHIWIKAEVEYGLEPKIKLSASGDKADNDSATAVWDTDAPLTVKVWTPKKTYTEGESIKIYIQGNRDFYARIIDITSSGEIIQLLPNDFRRTYFFEHEKVYKIPDKGDKFDLKVTAPFGQDSIVVYASDVQLGELRGMQHMGQGLRSFKGSRQAFATQTRGIKVKSVEKASVPAAEFYEAVWTITTRK
jgi:hypothetical protein